ncbi:MAG: DUF2339 domain-containing protein [Pseudomonadota bacterium]
METIIALIVLSFFGGIGLLIYLTVRVSQLGGRLQILEGRISELRQQLAGRRASPPNQPAGETTRESQMPASSRTDATEVAMPATDAPSSLEPVVPPTVRAPVSADQSDINQEGWDAPREPSRWSNLGEQIRENWMTWLGGVSLALAGIFMAIYSIEQGLLGPTARIFLGTLAGLAVHGTAEYLRRRTGSHHPVFAAMAAAGSITLYAMALVALEYGMISPGTAFGVMALVGLGTTAMAVIHGPLIAAMGILGAYIVPILVSSGQGQILVAMVYALVIAASGALLLRFVYRRWLWWGTLAGAMVWWLIALFDGNADGFRSWYLALTGFVMLALPRLDFTLRETDTLVDGTYGWRNLLRSPAAIQSAPLAITLIIAQGLGILFEGSTDYLFVVWSPLLILMLWVGRVRESFAIMPWLTLLVSMGAFMLRGLDVQLNRFQIDTLSTETSLSMLIYLGLTAVLVSWFALANLKGERFRAIWASLGVVGPAVLLIPAIVLTDVSANQWVVILGFIGLGYMALAVLGQRRATLDSLVVWLFFAGHLALSLAAIVYLDAAMLTVVFAAQAVSTAWIMRSFAPVDLGWLIKGLVLVVVVRLTLNPWVLAYPDVAHWTLWCYGGSTALLIVAWWILGGMNALSSEVSARVRGLRGWLEGAALHLFVLTVWTEIRYWLYEGDVLAGEFSAVEAALYVLLFGSLSVVYVFRSLVSTHIGRLYRAFALLLQGVAGFGYVCVVFATLTSLSWLHSEIGELPILNMTLLFYLAPVLVFAANGRLGHPMTRSVMNLLAACAAFIYVCVQIRHIWTGSVEMDQYMSNGELYTYSVVWLVIAIVAILWGSRVFGRRCYQAGLALLALVIAKIFLVDMSDLEGLLRIASFLGLGMALLGVSYLHRRLQNDGPQAESEASG